MLISPEDYRKENENKTTEELILERIKLFNEIVEYENKHIINNEPYSSNEIVKPSPKDVYNMHNLYLEKITDLIIEKSGYINVDKNHKEYLEKIEDFQKRLYDKGSFFLEIRSGAVIPKFSPNYYNKTDITLIEEYNSICCNVLINKNEYLVNDKQFSEIKQLVKDNLDELIQISIRQTSDMKDGTYNSILIKIGSILLNISPQNVPNDVDYKFIKEFKEKILNILINPSNIIKKYIYDSETKKWSIEDVTTTKNVENYMNKAANEYVPQCPNCNGKLSFMMTDGKTLYCDNCNKYFINNNGVAGEETGSPYTRKDVLY